MRIIHMKEGEFIKDINILSDITTVEGRNFDHTAIKYLRRVKVLIEKRCDFVESGISEDSRGTYWWFIWWTGDNCLRFYPEGLV